MKVVNLSAYNRNVLRALLSLEVIEKPIPELGPDEVVVKMHAASSNPSDIAFIQGGYNIVKTLPAVPGFEGSGTVIKTGKETSEFQYKKVSCFIQDDRDGTWAEYFTLKKENLIVLNDSMDMDQAACFSVNPFTAYALLKIAENRNCKTIIQNAAGGQVPALIRQLAKIGQIETINIVRKKETAEKLQQDGVEHVFAEQDEQFAEKMKQLSHDLSATLAFDAVAGLMTGTILNAMPEGGEIIVYGGLSNKPITEIDPMGIIFRKKAISGFNLLDWKQEIGREKFEVISNELQQLVIDNKLSTKIQGEVKIDDIVQGLKTYLGNMSKGKMLIRP
jgi:NADPH:quinone reductase-like Zn-dependent oxidoreductase